nr:unnamed protein product [Digitaria exilis]
MAGENLPIKIGTWGGNGGEQFDITQPPVRLESMTIRAGRIIDSFGFTYVDQEGKKHTVGPYGGYGGKPTTIEFAPTEYVKKFAGSTGNGVVATLVLETNLKTYEIYDKDETITYIPGTNIPIGTSQTTRTVPPFNIPLSEGNVPFSVPVPDNASIVGFYGRAGGSLDAIGVYVKSTNLKSYGDLPLLRRAMVFRGDVVKNGATTSPRFRTRTFHGLSFYLFASVIQTLPPPSPLSLRSLLPRRRLRLLSLRSPPASAASPRFLRHHLLLIRLLHHHRCGPEPQPLQPQHQLAPMATRAALPPQLPLPAPAAAIASSAQSSASATGGCGSADAETSESAGDHGEGAALQQLFSRPVLGLITKHFSVLYDIEERNTLLSSGAVRLRASHDAKSTDFLLSYVVMYLSLIYQLQQGEIPVITRLGGPLYKLELSSLVPYSGPTVPVKIGAWGGDSGKTFNVTDPPKRHESVTICAGDIVDSFGYSYVDQAGKKHTVGPCGGTGGRLATIQFAQTEYVKKFSGTIGSRGQWVVASLEIETNLQTYGPYGKETHNHFSIPIPENAGVVGFFGRAEGNLNAIGVYISNSKFIFADATQENSTNHATTSPQPLIITKEAGPIKIGTWGGDGGEDFDVTEAPKRLESVTIRAGYVVDAIGFSYIDQLGKKHTVGPCGGNGGNDTTSQLAPSEYVKNFYGTIGDFEGNWVVASLTIETNIETYGTYGTDQSTHFSIPLPKDASIVGFFGRAGALLDAIGVYVSGFIPN